MVKYDTEEHSKEFVVGAQLDIGEEEGPAPVGLGERIKQLRKELEWSQSQLGERIGVDSQRVSRYESEKIAPSVETLAKIAEAFNVSADYLLIDNVPRRPLHVAEHALGDRLAVVGELSDEDLAALLNVLDGLVMKNRLRTITGAGG